MGFAGQPMEMGRFLPLAVALSGALGQLHARGLIHKDIKAPNILIDPETGYTTVQQVGSVVWWGAGVSTSAPVID